MARKWTQSQQQAISARDGTLLVSAAAGSGKTAVLVQRVIERLTDAEHPCDADRLLVVTFTNAAAAEMRERIAAAISDLLLQDPYNTRLQRQQILLSRAHISTIHSFCSEMIRQNFYKLNVSAEFRISDSNEMTLLRDEAMQQVMEELYARENADFALLSDSFSTGRDDSGLLRTVSELYDFVRSHPFPAQWLEEKAAMYRPNCAIADTEWGKTILAYAVSAISYCISLTQNALDIMQEDEKIAAAYGTSFSSDLAGLQDLQQAALQRKWDTVSSKVNAFSFERLKALRGYKEDPLRVKICGNRDEVKSTIDKLKKLFFSNEQQCREDIARLAPMVDQLFLAVKRFGEKLDEMKSERRVADFGDLEHWMLRLLVRRTETGYERTEDAVALSKQFDEVMVDEYQDTNEAQDMIFRAISQNEQNLFVVGDVKQSIYRFRQAMPEIFLRRKASYAKYDPAVNKYPARVNLDKNFRSRQGVTDAVNFVFRQLMTKEMGEMDYTAEEELVAGATYPQKKEADTALHILDLSKWEESDMDVVESRHIAEIISKMVGEGYLISEGGEQRPATYRDFCVLLRNANSHAHVYASELQQCGIPAWSDTAGTFFGTTEVAVMLSVLRVIDNPVQDIPLLSVLMSPIAAFTPDDLSDIRLCREHGPLYFAVKKMAEEQSVLGTACDHFLQQMEEYRRLAATMPADRLIQYIYEKSGYLAMVQTMREGELRLANLRLLLEYARTYESSGYKGLSGFIRFIDRLEEQRSDLAPASVLSESANVVRVMSIHRSKGLEFPICILANCARKFNKDRGEVLIHPELGLGIKLRDEAMTCKYSTMPREAVALEIERGGMSEELRVLYVAMTRAKEKLIMLTSLKDPVRTLGRLAAQLTESPNIPPYVVRSAACFSDWILSCAIRHPSGAKLREISGAAPGIMMAQGEDWEMEMIYPESYGENQEETVKDTARPQPDEAYLKVLEERLSYRCPTEQLKNIPAKVAASELAGKSAQIEYEAVSRPAFMAGQSMTPAEKGTALHAFMQYADYVKAAQNASAHLDFLIAKGFLTPEQGKAVDMDRVNTFFQSRLLQRILASNKVMREYRFTVEITAGEVDPALPEALKNEPVVLQGAVDCVFEEEGALVIVDYKTDHIKDAEQLKQRYARQVELYAEALAQCTGLPVQQCVLYSFYLGREITV